MAPKHEKVSSPEILAAIGRVSTLSSWLEAIVEDLLAGLMKTKAPFLYALTSNVMMKTRVGALETLLRMRMASDSPDLSAAIEAIRRVEKLLGLRNTVVHGLWSTPRGTPDDVAEVVTTRSERKLKHRIEYQNAPYLEWLAKQIDDECGWLFGFGKQYGLIPDS